MISATISENRSFCVHISCMNRLYNTWYKALKMPINRKCEVTQSVNKSYHDLNPVGSGLIVRNRMR